MILIHFKNITSFSKLHYDAKSLRRFIIKSFLETDNIFMIVRGQYSNLIKSIFFFFWFHRCDFYLSQWCGTFFIAYYLPSILRFTLKTCPKAPSPSFVVT